MPLTTLRSKTRLAVVASYNVVEEEPAGSCRSAADRIAPSQSRSPTGKDEGNSDVAYVNQSILSGRRVSL